MASFVLVPGAGRMARCWRRVVLFIRAAGHEPIAIDLPGDDSQVGLAGYADIAICAFAERRVLVAQSLAGFTVPLVCALASVRMIVFVNAMIPKPGETASAWWDATGAGEARVQPRLAAAVRPNLIWERTFCTTCHGTCRAPARNNLMRKQRTFSASLVASSAGRER
jgi:Alpha/beta hydrolase family